MVLNAKIFLLPIRIKLSCLSDDDISILNDKHDAEA